MPSLEISAKNAREADVGCTGGDYSQNGVVNYPGSSIARCAMAKNCTSDSREKMAFCEGKGSKIYSSHSCRVSNLVDCL